MNSQDRRTPQSQAVKGPLRVVLIYALFSFLWILFSDQAVELLFKDRATMILVSMLKGWLFVAVTSLLLYVLVSRLVNQAMSYSQREQAARSESQRTGQLLAAVVDSSSDAIFAKDREGCYLLFNREAARVTGKEINQVLGQDDRALFPPLQAEDVIANDQAVMADGNTKTFEENLATVNGERVYLATKGPLRDAEGKIIGTYGIARDITERKHAEEALRKSEANFRHLFEQNSSVMLIINPVTGAVIDANKEAVAYYGYPRQILLDMSINDINTLSPERIAIERQRAMHGERRFFNFSHRLASGEIRDVEVHVTPIETAGQPLLLSIVYDITDRKKAEEALRESEERLRLALSASNQGWFDVDLRSGEVHVSPEYVRLIGYDPDNFESSMDNWLGHVHPEDRIILTSTLKACVEDGGPHTAEYRRQAKDGHWRWIRSIGKIVHRSVDGQPERLIGIHADITERKQMEEQVRQLAFYDPLTGLPNRRLLNDRLSQAMATSKRSGRHCALMFIDLDNFKPLNDTHGHEVGDLLLIEVANRMKSCVRETDTVARFGGDEFVVMICELDKNEAEDSAAQVGIVAEKIRLILSRPYVLNVERVDGQSLTVEHHCSASIGVVMFVNHEIEAGEILKRADLAMYQAKDAGRNGIRFFGAQS